MDAEKLESSLGLRDLGQLRQWHLQPTCAVTGDGLHEGMAKLQEMINCRRKSSRLGAAAAPAAVNGPAAGVRSNSSSKLNTKKLQRSHSHVY